MDGPVDDVVADRERQQQRGQREARLRDEVAQEALRQQQDCAREQPVQHLHTDGCVRVGER